MKKIITILMLCAVGTAAYAQSAIGQLERMTGSSISRYHNNESYRASASSGFDTGGFVGGVDAYADHRSAVWAERKAAQEAARAKARNKVTYHRTSHYKLKDVKPIDPKAGKSLPANLGATGDLSVYAKYDKKGNATYGIWNSAKSKWQYKPQYSALEIVGPHAAAATLKGKVGIIDPTTGKPTTNFTFDKYRGFHYPESALNTIIGLGNTSPEGNVTWRLFEADANGNYVQVGPEMSGFSCIEDGTGYKAVYRVKDSQKVGMMDELGKEVLPPVFDGLKYLEFTADDASCYQSRMVDAKGNSKYGIVDENGRILVPSIYDKVSAPEHGKYGIEVVQGSKIGWYGTDGQEIFPAAYDTLQMEHFWDGNKHRAYFHGSFIDENGTAWHALYDTQGNRLTELTNSRPSEDSIRDLAPQLEEYRIY